MVLYVNLLKITISIANYIIILNITQVITVALQEIKQVYYPIISMYKIAISNTVFKHQAEI